MYYNPSRPHQLSLNDTYLFFKVLPTHRQPRMQSCTSCDDCCQIRKGSWRRIRPSWSNGCWAIWYTWHHSAWSDCHSTLTDSCSKLGHIIWSTDYLLTVYYLSDTGLIFETSRLFGYCRTLEHEGLTAAARCWNSLVFDILDDRSRYIFTWGKRPTIYYACVGSKLLNVQISKAIDHFLDGDEFVDLRRFVIHADEWAALDLFRTILKVCRQHDSLKF